MTWENNCVVITKLYFIHWYHTIISIQKMAFSNNLCIYPNKGGKNNND